MFKLLLNCSLVKTSHGSFLPGINHWCCLRLYNKALIDQLARSIREKFRTLVFRTDLTSFGPYIQACERPRAID